MFMLVTGDFTGRVVATGVWWKKIFEILILLCELRDFWHCILYVYIKCVWSCIKLCNTVLIYL